jgi:rhodanese-related sulfurtransferase
MTTEAKEKGVDAVKAALKKVKLPEGLSVSEEIYAGSQLLREGAGLSEGRYDITKDGVEASLAAKGVSLSDVKRVQKAVGELITEQAIALGELKKPAGVDEIVSQMKVGSHAITAQWQREKEVAFPGAGGQRETKVVKNALSAKYTVGAAVKGGSFKAVQQWLSARAP